MLNAEKIIDLLQLEPLLLEGGFYRETYVSRLTLPAMQPGSPSPETKALCSAIYYLLTPETFSGLHRLSADEVYHFYLGDPVKMLLIYPDGSHRQITLGSDLAGGMHLQYVVPVGVWQGSRLEEGGKYALLGTIVAPAFESRDFEAAKSEELAALYPALSEEIKRLALS